MDFFKGLAPDDPNFLQLSENIYCHSPIKETVFGPHQPRPDFRDFLNFADVKFFPIGHATYNQLHFSTQVPARYEFIVNKEVKTFIDYWNKVYILKVTPDYPYFGKFTELEFMFFDSFSNYNRIISDGYFKDNKSLVKGIKKQMNTLSQKYPINKKLVLEEAKKVSPDLIKLLK